MSHTLFWGIAMLLLIAAELMTGTFYLLMISLGALVAALAAQLGASVTAQCLLAACVSTVAVLAWHLLRTLRQRRTASSSPETTTGNATFNGLDIGEPVQVQVWRTDGTARVHYRGAPWTAIAADPAAPRQAGSHTVVDIRGNQLVLRPVTPHIP